MKHLQENQIPLAVLISDTHNTENTIDIFKNSMVKALEISSSLGLSRVYHLGDVFNSRKAQPLNCLLSFLDILKIYNESNIELVSIVGNHDKIDHSSKESFLSAFSSHSNFNLFEDFGFINEKIKDIDGQYIDFQIFLLSYFELEHQRKFISSVDKNKSKNLKRLLFTHSDIIGGKQQGGNLSSKGLTVDELSVFDNVYSGHYHDRSIVGHCVYIGSSYQHNFGENLGKGVCILYWDSEFNSLECKYVELNSIRKLIRKYVPILNLDSIKPMDEEMINRGDRVQLIISTKEKDVPGITKKIERLTELGYEIVFETDNELINSQDSETIQRKSVEELFYEFCELQELNPESSKIYLK